MSYRIRNWYMGSGSKLKKGCYNTFSYSILQIFCDFFSKEYQILHVNVKYKKN